MRHRYIRRPTEDAAISRVMREEKTKIKIQEFEVQYTALRRWDLELVRLERLCRLEGKKLSVLLDLPSVYIQRRLALVSSYLSLHGENMEYLYRVIPE